jgi:hypothetical protein
MVTRVTCFYCTIAKVCCQEKFYRECNFLLGQRAVVYGRAHLHVQNQERRTDTRFIAARSGQVDITLTSAILASVNQMPGYHLLTRAVC